MLFKQKLFMSQVPPETPPLYYLLNVVWRLNFVKLSAYNTIYVILLLEVS